MVASGAAVRVHIQHPPSNSPVIIQDGDLQLLGRLEGDCGNCYVLIDIHTNRWYPQGEKIWPEEDGSFSQKIALGGEKYDRCHHLLRARVLDSADRVIAVTWVPDVARANPDGTMPNCQ